MQSLSSIKNSNNISIHNESFVNEDLECMCQESLLFDCSQDFSTDSIISILYQIY